MLSQFLLHSNMNQHEVYIYPLPLEPPSHAHLRPTPLGHHRAPSWAPCATRQFPNSHLCLTFMHWRRKWQPTPVFLPGESQGWWSLVGCCLWGRRESDTTEATQQQQQQCVYVNATLSIHLTLPFSPCVYKSKSSIFTIRLFPGQTNVFPQL